MSDKHIKWVYGPFEYQLVNVSDREDAPMWRVQSRLADRKDYWVTDYAIDGHLAACLEACADVPNLKPGMFAEAVELLRDIQRKMDFMPHDRLEAAVEAFLSKLDSEVQGG